MILKRENILLQQLINAIIIILDPQYQKMNNISHMEHILIKY